MRTPAEYRAEAETYVRCAEGAESDARGQRFLEMARACLRLADMAELLSSVPGQATARSDEPVYSGL
jgi:hypothetical protein